MDVLSRSSVWREIRSKNKRKLVKNQHNASFTCVVIVILLGITGYITRHFGSYKQSKLRGTRRIGRFSAVKSSQLSCAGQDKKCKQYNIKLTLEYSD